MKKKMLKGMTEEPLNLYSSLILSVEKKNGTLRFCVDYRKCSSVTEKDSYPLSSTAIFLGSTNWFSTLDVKLKYNKGQI